MLQLMLLVQMHLNWFRLPIYITISQVATHVAGADAFKLERLPMAGGGRLEVATHVAGADAFKQLSL